MDWPRAYLVVKFCKPLPFRSQELERCSMANEKVLSCVDRMRDDKYALVGLEVELDGVPPAKQVAPDLWALTAAAFNIPPEWREWLGSIRTDEVAQAATCFSLASSPQQHLVF